MTAHADPRGQLLALREAAQRGHMSESALRHSLYAGIGPPAFKRPGSSRWLVWSAEFDKWLESARAISQPSPVA